MPKVNTTDSIKVNTAEAMSESEIDALAQKVGKELAEQEKVEVRIPKVQGEDEVVDVCLNGYVFRVKRGETVRVPKAIAEVLKNANLI